MIKLGNNKKFTITTLGCKVNQFESEQIAKELVDAGFNYIDTTLPPVDGQADLCIINTCTVTHKASMQSRQAIRQSIRKHPDAVVIVTGCYAQTEPDAIRKIEGVRHIVPHQNKSQIPIMATSLLNPTTDAGVDGVSHDLQQPSFQLDSPWVAGANKTRPFLKIQDGCDAFCSYCIVPYARGTSRSVALVSVLKQLEQFKQDGYHEVVLTGIHLGRYGRDLQPPATLFDLLKQINSGQCIDRLRLSSIEPLELSGDIIRLVAESTGTPGEICHHFHIPLQSGDDDILKKMNRPYRRKAFKELVLDIHKVVPGAGIGCDVLIGFPGETDEAFKNTYALIRELPLTYLHVFPFSPREGTPASGFPGQIPQQVVKERCRNIRELGQSKRRAFLDSQTGESAMVLVENRRDRRTGRLKGVSANYITILVEGDDRLMNTFQEVQLTRLHDDQSMIGELL